MKIIQSNLFLLIAVYSFSCLSSTGESSKQVEKIVDQSDSLSIFDIEENQSALNDSINKYALLIGINDYKYIDDLEGCVNDIALMKNLLINNYQFPDSNIVTLINSQATREAIINTFQSHLINNADSGDVVVFHFSGHGSQQKDEEENEESDGYDETLLSYDFDDAFEDRPRGISDDEINGLLTQLTEQTNKVTFILDACHSAGATRNPYTARTPGEPDNRDPIPPASFAVPDHGEIKGKNSGYAVIAGCQSKEKSHELTFKEGFKYGALTYHLVRALKAAKGEVTYTDIMPGVTSSVNALIPDQHPQVLGPNADNIIFSDPVEQVSNFILVNPYKQDSGLVEGGKMLGITEGSIFEVYPPTARKFDSSEQPLGRIQISVVGDHQSKAEIIEGTIAKNARAVERDHNFEQSEINIRFKGSWDSRPLKSLKEKIIQQPFAKTANTSERAHLLLQIDRDELQFFLVGDTTSVTEIYKINENFNDELIVDNVKRWAQWFHVLYIENLSSQLSVDFNLVERRGRSPFEIFNDSSNIATFKHLDKVDLEIINNSDQDIYVFVVDLMDNGEIDVFHLGEFHNPPKPSNDVILAKKTWRGEMELYVTQGRQFSRDVFKLYASTDPEVNLKFLEQERSSRGEKEKILDVNSRPGRPNASNKEGNITDWITAERLVIVKRGKN